MRRIMVSGVVFVCLVAMASVILGLGGTYPKGKPVGANPDWPAGLRELVNFPGRVHGHFVNANDEFFYEGDTAVFNGFLDVYGKLKETPLTVTIHAGSARRSPLLGSKPERSYDWKMLILRRGWGAATDPKRPKGSPGYVVTVDVWIDKRVVLEEIQVPKSITLKSGGEVDAFVREHEAQRQPAKAKQAGPDLTIVGAIKSGDTILVGKSTPYLAIPMVELRPKQTKSRLMVSLRFRSRKVKGVKLDVALIDEAGEVLGKCTHVEEVGPEKEARPGENIGKVRRWDQGRAIWLDFAEDAKNAARFRLNVTAVR